MKEFDEKISHERLAPDCFWKIFIDELMKKLKNEARTYGGFSIEEITYKVDEIIQSPKSIFWVEFYAELKNRLQKDCGWKPEEISYKAIVKQRQKSENIPFIKSGNMARVKLSIGNTNMYYLLDSGSEYCIISSAYMTELLYENIIAETDYEYLGEQGIILADESVIYASIYLINGIRLGSYVLDKVLFATIDNDYIGFIAGSQMLNAFQSWKKDVKNSTLELVR